MCQRDRDRRAANDHFRYDALMFFDRSHGAKIGPSDREADAAEFFGDAPKPTL